MHLPLVAVLALGPLSALPGAGPDEPPALELRDGDTVALVGNAFVERLAAAGTFETLLRGARPELELRLRFLGWSGDTVSLRPRPLNFGDLHDHLGRVEADVVLLCFGAVESFDGDAGLPRFRAELAALVDELEAQRYGGAPPRLALVSPIAYEDLGPPLPDGFERNRLLARYTDAMRAVAAERGLPFADLYQPALAAYAERDEPLTIDGVHAGAAGDRCFARALLEALGLAPQPTDPVEGVRRCGYGFDADAATFELTLTGAAPGTYALELGGVEVARHDAAELARGVRVRDEPGRAAAEEVRALVRAKEREWFLRWRPVNGEYVFGRRAEPFGVVSFPPEMAVLDARIAELERRIAARVSATAIRPLRVVAVQ